MYPVRRTVSETGEPFHKQQLFLLLVVHVRRWSENVLSACIPSLGALSWLSHPCCTPEPLGLATPVPCCHIRMRASPEWCFVTKCHTLDSMVMEVFSSRNKSGILWAHLITLWSTAGPHFCSLWGAAAGWEQNKHFGFLYNEKPELDYIKSFEVLLNVWLPAQLVESAEKCLCCFSVNLKLIFSLPAWSATEGHLISVVPKVSCIHTVHAQG